MTHIAPGKPELGQVLGTKTKGSKVVPDWKNINATYTNKDATRTFNTVYQNTSGKLMFVSVVANFTLTVGLNKELDAYIGSTSTPTDWVGTNYFENANLEPVNLFAQVTFFVPVSFYYKVDSVGTGTSTEDAWIEYLIS